MVHLFPLFLVVNFLSRIERGFCNFFAEPIGLLVLYPMSPPLKTHYDNNNGGQNDHPYQTILLEAP
jgi:hypothetical protein